MVRLSSGLQMAAFLLCFVFTWSFLGTSRGGRERGRSRGREKEYLFFGVSSYKGTNPIMREGPNLNLHLMLITSLWLQLQIPSWLNIWMLLGGTSVQFITEMHC